MIKTTVSIDHVLEVLNRAVEKDPTAMAALFNGRVPCNQQLAEDQTIQCASGLTGDGNVIGPLGLINGFFGIDEETGYGAISSLHDTENELLGFQKTNFQVVKECKEALIKRRCQDCVKKG